MGCLFRGAASLGGVGGQRMCGVFFYLLCIARLKRRSLGVKTWRDLRGGDSSSNFMKVDGAKNALGVILSRRVSLLKLLRFLVLA